MDQTGAPNGHALVTVLNKLGLGTQRIGVLGLDPYPPFYFDGRMPYNTWKAVLDAFPDATFERVGERLFELTAPRSAEELAVIQWSAAVGEQMCQAMLEALRPGRTFGEVVRAMQAPLEQAGGDNIHPLIHSLNPYGLIGGFGASLAKLPEAKRYALTGQVPLFGAEVELRPGMTFSFEPSCLFGRRFVNLGGTVVVGDDKPIALNELTTHLMRAA